VVTNWTPPDAFEGVTLHDLKAVQDMIDAGAYRASDQSDDWAGVAVADVLGLDIGGRTKSERTNFQSASRGQVKQLLNQWTKSGALKVDHRHDEHRKPRPFIIVGEPVTAKELASCATTNKWRKSGGRSADGRRCAT